MRAWQHRPSPGVCFLKITVERQGRSVPRAGGLSGAQQAAFQMELMRSALYCTENKAGLLASPGNLLRPPGTSCTLDMV